MLGKIWKKLLLIVLIVACLFNIVLKLVQRNSLETELQATLQYMKNIGNTNKNLVTYEEE